MQSVYNYVIYMCSACTIADNSALQKTLESKYLSSLHRESTDNYTRAGRLEPGDEANNIIINDIDHLVIF